MFAAHSSHKRSHLSCSAASWQITLPRLRTRQVSRSTISILWRSKFSRLEDDFPSTLISFSLRAFNETLTVLQAAAKAVTQLSVFDLTDFEANNTVQEFEKAESVIKESFTSFGVSFFLMFSASPKPTNPSHAAVRGMVKEGEHPKGSVGKG